MRWLFLKMTTAEINFTQKAIFKKVWFYRLAVFPSKYHFTTVTAEFVFLPYHKVTIFKTRVYQIANPSDKIKLTHT